MTEPISPIEDVIVFMDEDVASDDHGVAAPTRPVWRILIIDDDHDVHTATTFALGNIVMQGRPLEFMHAYSATQARALLTKQSNIADDIAVILLDVVMEQEDAGLQLVQFIRDDCGMQDVRIILRTGQPGYAPEMHAISDYDINDYKTKSELTRVKLFTTMTAALRSYAQIRAISAGTRGLDQIISASAHLMAAKGMRNFSDRVMLQIGLLIDQPSTGFACLREHRTERQQDFVLVAGDAGYHSLIGRTAADLPDATQRDTVMLAANSRRNVTADTFCALYSGTTSCDFVVHVDLQVPLTSQQCQLLAVFSCSLAVCVDNMLLTERLHDVAFYDPLCKLPNRARLVNLLDDTLSASTNEDITLALIDIDHFAETNDAFGHQFGDLLLLAVATRLRSSLDQQLVVARVGGDTFCLIGTDEQVNPALILDLFATPFSVDGEAVPLTATVGLVSLTEYSGTGTDALKDADIALKRAKTRQRSGHCYFSRNMGVDIRGRVRMMHALRTAFEQRKLTLVYQPQINLSTRKVVGAEALLRWCGDDGQFIRPDVFIPIAENSGLIIELGAWVLRTACEQLVELRARGFVDFMMSVNVSQVQFRHPQFLTMLRLALEQTGAPAEFVELEITESVAMDDPALLITTLDQIKLIGMSIAIDDFGTGFSSLSYLQQLKVDRLKIDRAFVNEITDAKRGSSIAEMIIQLGHNLDLTVIAEGVEDERQADILTRLGCPLAQGYLFARPMAPELLPGWLQQHDRN
ncbi:putative bifunctional diguanylate cyclase/phosphodiesterase [Actimicrobium antarcticum]|uniref:EAL domain-containing protein n=1 Tax=Actimicrobium antarcticum TaxID=1051899 RepID=A0ABP7T1Z5_9BURK